MAHTKRKQPNVVWIEVPYSEQKRKGVATVKITRLEGVYRAEVLGRLLGDVVREKQLTWVATTWGNERCLPRPTLNAAVQHLLRLWLRAGYKLNTGGGS